MTCVTEGKKYDRGKPRLSLIPSQAMSAILEKSGANPKLAAQHLLDGDVHAAFRVCMQMSSAAELAAVLEFGLAKYGVRDGWRCLDHAQERYTDACLRHLVAMADELYDTESGLRHIAHAACCLAFLLELDELS